MKEPFEFYCEGGCRGYTILHLDIEIDECIIFKCPGPNCGHEHYRRMEKGQITTKRHSTMKDDNRVHLIEPTKAAFSKEARLGKLQKEKGFIGNLWGRMGGGP